MACGINDLIAERERAFFISSTVTQRRLYRVTRGARRDPEIIGGAAKAAAIGDQES
jgi:hypothetical protein